MKSCRTFNKTKILPKGLYLPDIATMVKALSTMDVAILFRIETHFTSKWNNNIFKNIVRLFTY